MIEIDGHALVVGVSGYLHVRPLPPTADAADVAELLRSHKHGRYPPGQVHTLVEHEATRANLLAGLDALAEQSTPSSTVLFYFSGHGGRLADGNAGECYLMPVDADWRSHESLAKTALSSIELAERLRAIKARHFTVILDCCRAAGLAEVKDAKTSAEGKDFSTSGLDGKLPRDTLGALVQGGGRVVLAASRIDGSAYVLGGDRNGLFTRHLLEGLRGAAGSSRGRVWVFDVFRYLQTKVVAEMAGQRPVFKAELEEEFPLAFCPDDAPLAPPAPATPPPCPYRGMLAFTRGDAKQFRGRAREIGELLSRLRQGEREIYVIGPSGSGKSSLIDAGLLPLIASGSRPFESPFLVLEGTLRPDVYPTDNLSKLLGGDAEKPGPTLDALLARAPTKGRVLLFIDQLEELFTISRIDKAAGVDERHRFVNALRALRQDPRFCMLLALRGDFYGALLESELWPERGGRKAAFLPVAPLSGEALAEAIEVPAQEVGVVLQNGLVERLVADAANEPGALPLLQETLALLWEKQQGRQLRLNDYKALGGEGKSGLSFALAQQAEHTIGTLKTAPRGQPGEECRETQDLIAQRMVLRLVSFGEGRRDTRRQQPRAALLSVASDTGDAAFVLKALIDGRLLTASGDAEVTEARIDLSHEAILVAWPRLQGWLEARRDAERERRLYEGKVLEWLGHEREAGLLDAVELGKAEAWLKSEGARSVGLPVGLADLIKASTEALEREKQQREDAERRTREERLGREDAERRGQRRLKQFICGLTLFGVVVSGSLCFAWSKAQETRQQLGQTYKERGRQFIVEGRPLPALPYLEAARQQGVDDVPLRMLFAEASQSGWLVNLRHAGPVSYVAFSPDGSHVATASRDGTARVWDATTGDPLSPPLRHQGYVYSVTFSPDGSRVITASEDKTARLWDAASGASLLPPFEHQGGVTKATFSPDGLRVVTASSDRTARIWDAGTGAWLSPPLQHQASVYSAVFSPDGSLVVTASKDNTAQLWEAATGAAASPPMRHQGPVYSAFFSPNGSRVVTASEDKTAQVWDVATGAPLSPPIRHQRHVHGAVFSPDGSLVVTASGDRTARVWNASSGTPVSPSIQHQSGVLKAVFSPDGSRVVTASADQTARVWNARSGDALSPPLKHDGPVYSVMFSSDGSRVLTASWDNTARVWDATTGVPLSPPFQHQGPVRSAAFSPDGSRVVTASDDKTARVWDTSLDNSTLEQWHLRTQRCSPYLLEGGLLMPRPLASGTCPMLSGTVAARSLAPPADLAGSITENEEAIVPAP